MKINLHSRTAYMGANYAAYVLNFFSGLILARNLGPDGRGELAFLSSFYLITLLFASMNSRNGSSLASIKNQTSIQIKNHFPFSRIYFNVALITFTCTLAFFIVLNANIETKTLLFFSISNVACGLSFYLQFSEGILRVQEKLFELAVLRFLGLAIPSMYIFVLYFLGELNIELALLSQFLAVVACFFFLRYKQVFAPRFNYVSYLTQVKKTYIGYLLEYIANVSILLSVTFTEDSENIGYFAVALSFILISETFYPLIESRMFNRIYATSTQKRSLNLLPLASAIKELVGSQIVFVPIAYLIPIIYGSSYRMSINFALVLILARLNYSIVKLLNSYAVMSERYDIPIKLNSIYITLYFLLFLLSNGQSYEFPWQISSIVSSICVVFLGFLFVRNLKPDHQAGATTDINSGVTNV